MTGENRFVRKLEKWVEEHAEEADVPQINLTTQKEFTIRGILRQLAEAEETGAAIVDREVLEIKDLVEKWIER